MSINIGSACIDRSNMMDGDNLTYIDLANPADYTGKITSIQIWAAVSMASAKVATFYKVGSNYTARDVSAALGAVASGAARTFVVNLDVVAGDYIGIYFTDDSDYIEMEASGGSGVVWKTGDQTACIDESFTLLVNYAISLYGTGIITPVVTTIIPTNISRADPTAITANGEVELDVVEDITTRGFKYGLTEEDTWDESETGTYSEGTFSLQLTGLTADTTYYIRAYATMAWGTVYGAYLEFITAIPYGSFESRITAEATASDADIALVGGERSLAIDNHLIQTQTIADLVAAGYLADYKDQKTKLTITKPTPAPYGIGDTIERLSAKLPYAPAVSAVIAYAPATDGLYYYNLAGRDMLIRKLNVSFSAGDYVSVIELEN